MRTTDPSHRRAVEAFWTELDRRGHIYESEHEGWYSVNDETFVPKTALTEQISRTSGLKILLSQETGHPVEWTKERNYHFRLSNFTGRLLDHYTSSPKSILPGSRYRDVIRALESGLDDLSISRPRDRLEWGIPVPADPSQTIYVWLDALVGYLTKASYPWKEGENKLWPADVHVIGKDIVRFHCIYWPAFLMAAELPLPKTVLTHAHWTMNRVKMSKSLGNVVDPFMALKRFGPDCMRYYLFGYGGLTNDRDYSSTDVIKRYKTELQFQLGNLMSRIMSSKFDMASSIKHLHSPQSSKTQEIANAIDEARETFAKSMDECQFENAAKSIFHLVGYANNYMQLKEPWAIPAGEKKDMIIADIAEIARVCGILLQPIMPGKASAMLSALDVHASQRSWECAAYKADLTYGMRRRPGPQHLFPPLESYK